VACAPESCFRSPEGHFSPRLGGRRIYTQGSKILKSPGISQRKLHWSSHYNRPGKRRPEPIYAAAIAQRSDRHRQGSQRGCNARKLPPQPIAHRIGTTISHFVWVNSLRHHTAKQEPNRMTDDWVMLRDPLEMNSRANIRRPKRCNQLNRIDPQAATSDDVATKAHFHPTAWAQCTPHLLHTQRLSPRGPRCPPIEAMPQECPG
jgi:hypothetical protein